MPNICEYTVQLDEAATSYDDCVARVQRLVKLYRGTEHARSDAGKYRNFILSSPFGSTLLWSNVKHDVPRISLAYRDGEKCTFPTKNVRCILPLAALLVLGSNTSATLSVQFHGEMPSEEVMLTASQLARQVRPGLVCPSWFPDDCFYGRCGEPISVPNHLDFRA